MTTDPSIAAPSDPGAERPDPVPPAPADEGLPGPASLDHLAGELDAVERALARLDEGTYGTCEACGAGIADEVLAAEPATSRCAQHAA